MNRHILSLLCVLAAALGASAQQFTGNGYYRIQNNHTERYCYLVDNWVLVDQTASKVTLSSIELWKNIERAQSDPSTVLYISQVGSKYNIEAQGTSLYDMAEVYLSLRLDNTRNAYLAYGTYAGMTKYLTDNTPSLTAERSWMCDTKYGEYSYWRLLPISNSTDNFFGIKPTVTAGGKHYASLYCDFPFEAAAGMNIYYVSSVDAQRGLAIYKPIENGKVAARTPMFIQCGSSAVSGNKVNIGVSGATSVSDNKLTGVYFNVNNYFHPHVNQVKYNASTMRLLGTTANGEIGFVTSTAEYVPSNSVYLSVPANSPADFKLVTPAEYQYILEHEVIEASSVTLSQSALTLQPGQSAQLTATVAPANTTDKTVTWSTSNAAVATVDQTGKVSAVAVGTATVTAKCGNVTATCTVTVNPIPAQSVTLSQSALSLLPGQTATLTATVLPENTTNKTVTWSTSNAAVATVDANGKVTAVAVGNATVTAICGSVSATCAVTVNPIEAQSVTLNKTDLTLLIGSSEILTATVLPENTTNKTVTWSTSNAAVATVDANGKVTAVALGSATVTATCGNVSATCAVTVNPVEAESVTINKSELTLLLGSSETLTATVLPANTTDKTVTWSTSNAAVATVDSNGKVTAVALGSATVTATCGNVSATCAVTVNPVEAESIELNMTSLALYIGGEETLTAAVYPENTTDKTLTWSSSDASVATVDNNGHVKAVALGTANITVACGTVSANCEVAVYPIGSEAIALNKVSLDLCIGEEETLIATVLPEDTTDKTVTWTTSDAGVASVDANGKVTAVAVGTATVTATCGNVSATCQVAVSKHSQEIVWTQTFGEIFIDTEIELTAEATSGLQVAYSIVSGGNLATLKDNKIRFEAAGSVEVCATQDGDEMYLAAEPVTRTITVQASGLDSVAVGNEAIVEVYTTMGVMVYRGVKAEMPATLKGIYIVLIDGRAFKTVL